MRIPDEFESILNFDDLHLANTKTAIHNTELWLKQSPCVFFPEYTRHDNQHNDEVLRTALELTTKEARSNLSPADVAVLIGAILLHDSAMHLTEDSFLTLVSKSSPLKPIPGIDTISWRDAWENFLGKAARYDQRALVNILGDATEPARRPPNDYLKWTEKDKRLIGEFLRIHHPRLAHEIAIYGVPGAAGGTYKIFPESAPDYIVDLSGLVARSHGIDLRSSFSFLEDRYDLRDFNRIHAVYLMTLLRIADYLQIQGDRAPIRALELRKLKSPLSQQEWRVHACVRNITTTKLDPESIFIDAAPEDAQTFQRIRQWMDGIQYELDASWAAIGEVYGRFTKERLTSFELSLRRIKSNIDDLVGYRAKSNFVPEVFRFRSAGPDLLRLLVSPLYAGDVFAGVRELTQNAMDAVREKKSLLADDEDSGVGDEHLDVEIRVVDGVERTSEFFEIRDRGVGMNAEMVRDYFLTAGASFRRSDAWRKDYEDDTSKSKVARSGRFGVGALAAFLLGEEIYVETRRHDEPEDQGLCFNAKMDDEFINVQYKKLDAGTFIRVRLSEVAREQIAKSESGLLRWHWMKTPTFGGASSGERQIISKSEKRFVPEIGDKDLPGWALVNSSSYEQIHWGYTSHVWESESGYRYGRRASAPTLFCNGIPIVSSKEMYRYSRGLDVHIAPEINRPLLTIAVIDNDGLLPVNLSRTSISAMHPDNELLLGIRQSISEDYVMECLQEFPVNSPSLHKWLEYPDANLKRIFDSKSEIGTRYLGQSERQTQWAHSVDGAFPFEPGLFAQLGYKRLLLIPKSAELMVGFLTLLKSKNRNDVAVVGYEPISEKNKESLRGISKDFFNNNARKFFGNWHSKVYKQFKFDFGFIHSSVASRLHEIGKLPGWLSGDLSQLSEDWNPANGASDLSQSVLTEVLSDWSPNTFVDGFIVCCELAEAKADQSSELQQSWSSMIGKKPIPFSQKKRQLLTDKNNQAYLRYLGLRRLQ